ncbi:MAG: glycosyltransferase family 4 protein [Cytophagales bacterium]|nr:glycosyltransferase family 4 protein [Cytophagales bacterium]
MKILLVSYYFPPENTPRAHRTFFLAKEFAHQGHQVTVCIPNYDFDYSNIEQDLDLNIKKVSTGFFFNRNAKAKLSKAIRSTKDNISYLERCKNFAFKYGKKMLNHLLPDGKFWEYSITLKKTLLAEKHHYDMLISVSYPFPVHLGTALALKKNPRLAKISVADYGDPFFYHFKTPKTFYFKSLEAKVMNKFNYITVPTTRAIKAYLHYKSNDKIKVITQGIDLENIKTAKYRLNKITTFAYAGVFYKKVRDPKIFFDYLLGLKAQFNFLIYTNFQNGDTISILEQYRSKLNGKLCIHSNIPRSECIYELSKADFLINVDYLAPYQSPSKIIDYALAGRPILSFNQNSFSHRVFDQFLKGDYSKRLKVDLNKHNIEHVCNKFIELYNEKSD